MDALEYKHITLNSHLNFGFWCCGRDFNIALEQPRFKFHQARI